MKATASNSYKTCCTLSHNIPLFLFTLHHESQGETKRVRTKRKKQGKKHRKEKEKEPFFHMPLKTSLDFKVFKILVMPAKEHHHTPSYYV